MADIRNSISLSDHMTPTLRSIFKAMDSTLKVMKQVDKQSNKGMPSKAYIKAENDIRMANNAIIKFKNYTAMAAMEAHNVDDAWQDVNGTLNKSNRTLGSMMTSIASGIYTIKNGIQAISSLTDIADASTADMAKLSLFNNSGASDLQVYKKVYDTAQESRSDLSATSELTQRVLLSNTYEGPGSVGRAIDLAGTINKAMVLGGGSSEENNRAIVQLSQALSSGILQGDELRSIREQSPYLAKVLAEGLGKIDDKFIGTTIGDLKELGATGQLTSKTVIQALEAMSDQISQTFDDKAPKTFSGAVTSVKNSIQFFIALLQQSGGALDRLNKLAWEFAEYLNTPQGLKFMSAIGSAISVVVMGFGLLSKAIQFVGNNMDWLAPIFNTILGLILAYNTYMAISKGVTWAQGIAQGIAAVAAFAKARADNEAALAAAAAGSAAAASASAFTADAMATSAATAAQHGLNAALWACPITWIIAGIILLIGVIFLVVGVINQATGSTISALGVIVGAILSVVAFVWNLFIGLLNGLIQAFWTIFIDPITGGIEWFVNAFNGGFTSIMGAAANAIGQIVNVFLSGLKIITKAIDAVANTNFTAKISGWQDTVTNWGKNKTAETYRIEAPTVQDFGLDRWSYSDAYKTGYEFGSDIQNKFKGLGEYDFDMEDMLSGGLPTEITGGNLDSVDKINSDVNISDEDLKLLRDMSAREFLLQLQTVTPVANIKFGDVKETADVGKIVEVIEQMVEEQMATALVS